MTFKVAGSLLRLRDQVDTLVPNRSRLSDGTIASSTHTTQNPGSDHEPRYIVGDIGYVMAIDITHDPAGGLDCERLFDVLWASRDPRIKYVIWNREITSGNGGPNPWYSRVYKGTNPHTKHLHLSVAAESASLLQADWNLNGLVMPVGEFTPPPSPLDPSKVWGFPVHDLYTSRPDDVMSAGVALEWAVRHAALANEAAQAALITAQRIEAKLDRLIGGGQ